MPPLNALKCFEAAVRSGSFSNAANELHVTQSAVSHQIRQLEDWFGFQLFERLGRNTVPTARAAELARALADAFGIISTACRRASQAEGKPVLTIAAIPSIATIWLIPRLPQFLQANPDVTMSLVYAFHGNPVDFGHVDLAILFGHGAWDNARATKFLSGDNVAVCSRSFLEKHGPFREAKDLLSASLLHDTDQSGWQTWFRAAGLAHTEPQPGPIFEDFNLLRSAALAGSGAALCPASLIADDFAAGRLVQIFPTIIGEDRAYYLVEPAAATANGNAASKFKDWLLKTAKETQGA
jgi:DNA-binding transcriptional LysR family regulator